MSTKTLADVYRRYLQCLNERRWDELGQFVAEDAVHNERPLGLRGYREMLEADVAAIPDLQFVAEFIVAQDDVVSSRLNFHCRPERTFLGFEPAGLPISFSEHVFYRFRGSKIIQVWSLIDTQAIADQVAR